MSSNVTRGSTLYDILAPLTVKVTLAGAGPMAGASGVGALALASSTRAAGTEARAVAATPAPEPRRNSRREGPGGRLLWLCGSFIAGGTPLVTGRAFGNAGDPISR